MLIHFKEFLILKIGKLGKALGKLGKLVKIAIQLLNSTTQY